MSSEPRWPPLNCLRGFVAAARRNSFSAAAESLHITQSAVSHQIKTLESWLDQPLFIRRRRHIELTDAGIDLLATADHCLATLDKGLRRLEQYKKPNQLIVHTGADFAAGWLVSRLAQFRQRFPEVDLWLFTTERAPDLSLAEIHCAIVRERAGWQYDGALRLFDDARVPLCAPGHPLLANAGREPGHLLEHALLHDEDELTWGDWFQAVGMPGANPVAGMNFSSQALMLQAAELGQGIALGSVVAAADRLESGRLAVAMSPVVTEVRSYYLVRRQDSLRSEHFEPFSAWLQSQCQSQPPLPRYTGA